MYSIKGEPQYNCRANRGHIRGRSLIADRIVMISVSSKNMHDYTVDEISTTLSHMLDHCIRHVFKNEDKPECEARIYLVNGMILDIHVTYTKMLVYLKLDGVVLNDDKQTAHVIVGDVRKSTTDTFKVIHGKVIDNKYFEDSVSKQVIEHIKTFKSKIRYMILIVRNVSIYSLLPTTCSVCNKAMTIGDMCAVTKEDWDDVEISHCNCIATVKTPLTLHKECPVCHRDFDYHPHVI
jgi:hypothetical protein